MKTPHTKIASKQKKEQTSIPWREVLKEEIAKYGKGGVVLHGLRVREDLTQKRLAECIGVSLHHISKWRITNGPIGMGNCQEASKSSACQLQDVSLTRFFLQRVEKWLEFLN